MTETPELSPRLGIEWDDVMNPRTGRPMCWDRHGQPISMRRWVALFEVHDRKSFRRYRRVARSTVGPYELSTVWLGLDHGFLPVGRPLIFETMLFARRPTKPGPGGLSSYHREIEGFVDRYATEAGARRGHWRIRRMVREHMHKQHGPGPLCVKYHRGRRRG